MKVELSEFVLTGVTDKQFASDRIYTADITVKETSGLLFWKNIYISRRSIMRTYFSQWHYVTTGKYIEQTEQIEALERAYRAQHGVEEE